MWNLTYVGGQVKDLFETNDDADVMSGDVLEQFLNRNQALVRVVELGLSYQDPEAYDISKLTIRRRLRVAGLEEAFNSALDANPQAKSDWTDAQIINTNDPLVLTLLPQLQITFGVSDAIIKELLSPE